MGRVVPQTLSLGIGLDQSNLLLRATGQAQVSRGLIINGEDGARGAKLRTHVADRGAVSQRHRSHTLTVELHELAHYTMCAQHFRDRQDEVSSGSTGR